MLRLSIIIPFFNVEKYIKQCICSLYCQDIPANEYEVICVDDCSPDNSAQIIKRLQAEFQNLFILKQERNHKLGSARNLGVKYAKGKYIWFVDSDDYIEPNCLGSLLQIAEQNDLDILHFDYNIDKNQIRSRGCKDYFSSEIEDGISFLTDESNEKWYERCPVAWRKLHKTEFLRKNNLSFADDVMYEDTDYSFRAFALAERVMHINHVAYNYRINDLSVTRKKDTGETLFFKIMLLSRSAQILQTINSSKFRAIITNYIHNDITQKRTEIKDLGLTEKYKYVRYISRNSICNLRDYCTWRTWLAVRYGMTLFCKN